MDAEELRDELAKLKAEKELLSKVVSHDIRSPFNRIFALLQLFEFDSKDLSDIQNDYIQSIYLSTLSGLEMITNLKDMREIDEGNISIDKSEFDLLNTIQKSVRFLAKQIELKKQHVTTNSSIKTAPLISDEYLIQRVIVNVLSNAVKFSKAGDTINLSISSNRDNYLIDIKDAGAGIKLEEEVFLYEKFKKLSSNASGGESSLGLGLYNTASFLDYLGGKISLVRHESIGSTFQIEVPK